VFQFFVRDILGMAGGIIFAYAAGASNSIAPAAAASDVFCIAEWL
jgi:hypothetical protein